jgi:hypothetical protein
MYDTDSAALILMIDIKNNPVETYMKLKQIIRPYQNLFMQWSGDTVVKKGVLQLMLSGAVPRDTIMADSIRLVCLDGSIKDTSATVSKVLVPRVALRGASTLIGMGPAKCQKKN